MKDKKRIWMVLVLIWMAVIFSFSAKPADESSQESLFVGRVIGQIFVKEFDDWTPQKQEAFAEKINYPVRKAAHATEYAILGALVMMRCRYQTGWRRNRIWLTAWGISILYAVTDEIHQSFVPGRACMVTDVMIDSAGALAGILLSAAVSAIIIGKKRRR